MPRAGVHQGRGQHLPPHTTRLRPRVRPHQAQVRSSLYQVATAASTLVPASCLPGSWSPCTGRGRGRGRGTWGGWPPSPPARGCSAPTRPPSHSASVSPASPRCRPCCWPRAASPGPSDHKVGGAGVYTYTCNQESVAVVRVTWRHPALLLSGLVCHLTVGRSAHCCTRV